MALRCSNKQLCSLTSLCVHSFPATDLHTGCSQETAETNKTNNGYASICTLALWTVLVCQRWGWVCKKIGVTSDPKVATVCLNCRTSVVWNGISKPAELEVATGQNQSSEWKKTFPKSAQGGSRKLQSFPFETKLNLLFPFHISISVLLGSAGTAQSARCFHFWSGDWCSEWERESDVGFYCTCLDESDSWFMRSWQKDLRSSNCFCIPLFIARWII